MTRVIMWWILFGAFTIPSSDFREQVIQEYDTYHMRVHTPLESGTPVQLHPHTLHTVVAWDTKSRVFGMVVSIVGSTNQAIITVPRNPIW